ncbi:MAG TPA: hypothetical protein VES01_07680 [Dermatophilaceae bacterium]|nr:hypothetical protein [Dermatophilaceae bacterium]
MSRPVLVALSPSGEAQLVTTLLPSTRVEVVRRCVDVPDLLGAAAAGLGRAALVSADMPGLDRSGVTDLLARGVAVVGVAAAGNEEQERFLRQIGVDVVVGSDADVTQLEGAVESARASLARRRPPLSGGPAVVPDLALSAAPVVPNHLGDLLAAGLGNDAATGPHPVANSDGSAEWDRVESGSSDDGGPALGRIVAVWGPTGAPGRTTLAVNLAAECAELGIDTLLVDADPYGGVVAAALALVDEGAGLAAAVRASEQGLLDAPALSALTPRVCPGLRVLTGLPRADRWIELRSAGVGHVLGVARLIASLVVVDCGFSLEDDEELSYDTAAPRRNAATLAALEAADDIVVVGAGDPIGLQRLVRGLQELDAHRAPGTRHVVVNKIRAGAVGPSPQDRIQAALTRFAGVPACHLIPDDRPALDAVTLAGRTLTEAARTSPARLAIRGLAEQLAEQLAAAHVRDTAGTGGSSAVVDRLRRPRSDGSRSVGRRWRRRGAATHRRG